MVCESQLRVGGVRRTGWIGWRMNDRDERDERDEIGQGGEIHKKMKRVQDTL